MTQTPIQQAIAFWKQRYDEAKEERAFKMREAAGLFIDYLRKNQARFSEGLIKGIEIAEGFAEWVEDLYMQEEKGRWYAFDDHPRRDCEDLKFFTTSKLLQMYLETLNKEK